MLQYFLKKITVSSKVKLFAISKEFMFYITTNFRFYCERRIFFNIFSLGGLTLLDLLFKCTSLSVLRIFNFFRMQRIDRYAHHVEIENCAICSQETPSVNFGRSKYLHADLTKMYAQFQKSTFCIDL